MSDNVLPFAPKSDIKEDQATGWKFLFCVNCAPNPDEPDPGFAPLVCFDKKGPIIAALICLGCETRFKILNGRLDVE
jgi:hypothetical protein